MWRNRKNNKENQEKNVRDDDAIDFQIYGSECWTRQEHDEEGIFTAEMGWLGEIAGISNLQEIRNCDIRRFLCI